MLEHDDTLISNWNEVVRDEDTVYHLGDVALGRNTYPNQIIPCLNGTKILVAGNHDVYWSTEEWLEYGFSEVRGCVEFNRFILTHIPVHRSQSSRFRGNIHGHLHHNKVLDESGYPDPWYRCVSVEQTELKPINIQDVIKEFNLV